MVIIQFGNARTNMRKIIVLSFMFIILSHLNNYAGEKYGDKLNIGFGIGYTGYYSSQSLVHLNYEFDAGRNFTIAPFITFYTYHYGFDTYWETVVPIGVKGFYYFDQLLGAGPRWDFYGAGSLGLAIVRNRAWDSEFRGDQSIYGETYPLYLDLHLGARFHLSKKVGLFLDISTGISTFGLSFSL
jgi:hypothetical protein